MQAPARRSTRKDRGENIRVTGALLRKAAISVFCGQRSSVVLLGVRKKGKPSFINCSKPFIMLWGGVGMFLSLLQFFATKFLVLALHLESGSFLLSLRMSKKLSSILISIGKTDDTSFIGWFCGAIRFFIFRLHFFCFLLTMPR